MKRILVVKLSALGDIVHCLPAVAALQKAFPEAHIDWLVEQKNRILIDRSSLHVRVLPLDTASLRSALCRGAVSPLVRFVKKLREEQYDGAIDFQGLMKSAFWTYLSGAPRRIGFSWSASREPLASLFYTDRITPQRVHIVDQLHELLLPLGICGAHGDCSLTASETAQRAMQEKQGSAATYIVIHPGGGWPTKRWPLARFHELARKLAAEGFPVILTFSHDEKEVEQGNVSEHGIYKVKTSLDELMALCARACLFIAGDTGPLHMAAAMNVPLVAIFGPTSSDRNGPLKREDRVVEHALSCRPCYKRKECPLGHWNCMQELSVEEVYQACRKRLVQPEMPYTPPL